MSRHYKNRRAIMRTLIVIGSLSFATTIAAFIIQKKAEASIQTLCSYLDPPIIDLVAFAAALYLIIEGIYHLIAYQEVRLKEAILAGIRIAFGFSILTLHILQFIHK